MLVDFHQNLKFLMKISSQLGGLFLYLAIEWGVRVLHGSRFPQYQFAKRFHHFEAENALQVFLLPLCE